MVNWYIYLNGLVYSRRMLVTLLICISVCSTRKHDTINMAAVSSIQNSTRVRQLYFHSPQLLLQVFTLQQAAKQGGFCKGSFFFRQLTILKTQERILIDIYSLQKIMQFFTQLEESERTWTTQNCN